MALVGYVTLEEANDYVSTRYSSADKIREDWESTYEEDQVVYLQRSFDILNTLPFSGRKTDCSQSAAFPRWPSEAVPVEIKYAQIENALAMTDAEASEDAAFYTKLWRYGVESYSIGNLSESSSSGTWGQGGSSSQSVAGVVSARAANFLAPYLRGGFNIE